MTPNSAIPPARLTYLGVSAILRRHFSTTLRRKSSGAYKRSDLNNQGYTGIYEPGGTTEGPLRDASVIGVPRITPVMLKQHLDQFVVGQERAKKTLATAVFNHYQRVQELQRRDEEEEERLAAEDRRRMAQHPRHPVEGMEGELKRGIAVPSLTKDWHDGQDEFPGQQQTTGDMFSDGSVLQSMSSGSSSIIDHTPLTIEKSNVMLLGPSGVGKTLMARTLARVLEVPFSISDCTPFTQAGYIGEDAEVCIQRLLAAANYDVARAERGIICLDEIDKIATARVSHGKDVSGEGVQQALLKIIEGTVVQVQAKQERGSNTPSDRSKNQNTGFPAGGSLSGSLGQQSAPPGSKGEVYNVRTDNILFICAGAFNGLHKSILDRISKGSIGFGATVRAAPNSNSNLHETVLEGEDELFEKHVPFYRPPPESSSISKKSRRTYNTLDLVEPQDLQKFGLIPELVGRIPLTCALSSLDVDALVQVLTEPRNSLLQQYMQLFALSSIELRFTTPALHVVARSASVMNIGARALRTVMERLLAECMFETPGSTVKYVLVHEAAAERKAPLAYFTRGQSSLFHGQIAEEEDAWEERMKRERDGEDGPQDDLDARARNNSQGGAARTFEEYRVKASAAGFV